MSNAINFLDLDGDGGRSDAAAAEAQHRDKRAATEREVQQQQPARATLSELADLYENYAAPASNGSLSSAAADLAPAPPPPAYVQLDALLAGEFLTPTAAHEEIVELLSDPFVLLGDTQKALTILQLSKFVGACVTLGQQQYVDAPQFVERVYALDETGLARYLDCAEVREHVLEAVTYVLVTLQLHHHLYGLYLLWTDTKRSGLLRFTGFLLFPSAEAYDVGARTQPQQPQQQRRSVLAAH